MCRQYSILLRTAQFIFKLLLTVCRQYITWNYPVYLHIIAHIVQTVYYLELPSLSSCYCSQCADSILLGTTQFIFILLLTVCRQYITWNCPVYLYLHVIAHSVQTVYYLELPSLASYFLPLHLLVRTCTLLYVWYLKFTYKDTFCAKCRPKKREAGVLKNCPPNNLEAWPQQGQVIYTIQL